MWERAFIPTDRGTFEVFMRGEGKPLAVTHLYSEFNETGDRFANTLVPHRKTFLVNLREAERMQELRGLQLQQDSSSEQKGAYGQETTKLSLFKSDNYSEYFAGNIRKSVAPVRLNHFSRHDFPKFDLTGELPDVRTRTLVMCGRHDVQCPIRCSEEICDLMPNAEMMVFEESNHYAFLEESDKFADTVEAFLKP